MKICLLGASFDTGNMGVSALAESSIKCILNRWPDADVTILAGGRESTENQIRLMDRDVLVHQLPIRFCKNVFLPNHFCVFLMYACLLKFFTSSKFKVALAKRNPYLRRMIETDIVADITGGDSFSDIYGMRRFIMMSLVKWLVMLFGIPLVLLPQTYGPFKKRVSRMIAKYILKRADIIYSRDIHSMDYVKNLLGNHPAVQKVHFVPDVAFVLDASSPVNLDTGVTSSRRSPDNIIVGLNVSGLLYNGGYTRDNMFSLEMDYRQMICQIIELLLENEKVTVLLIPHVFPSVGYEVESDPNACLKVYERMIQKYPDRIFLTKGRYNHNEIKYIIGLCDFFIGSRMHACIAAISQNIPTVGLAYSKKFEGVFESVGLGDCLADMRNCGEKQTLEKIESVFKRRNQIRSQLERVIPKVKEDILGIFNNSCNR